jgi:hypothetical protein
MLVQSDERGLQDHLAFTGQLGSGRHVLLASRSKTNTRLVHTCLSYLTSVVVPGLRDLYALISGAEP